MKNLNTYLKKIEPADREYLKKAEKQLAEQARPAGSLGRLESCAAKLASISRTLNIDFKKRAIIVCAGDHGVCEEGVSLFPQEVTEQMVYNFINGGASINVLAKHAGADVYTADLGVNCDFPKETEILHKKVGRGTKNFFRERAMSREEAVQSVINGIDIVEEICNTSKPDLIATGDMGIGNTTASAAIIAAVSGIDPKLLTGRGTGLGDQALENKINVIREALRIHKPDSEDAIDILSAVGGFEIGGLCGLVLGAAANKIPVICDGLISTAGALLAYKLSETAAEYLFAAHNSVETGHKYMLDEMKLTPLLDLGFRLGEGTGAALAMNLLDASARILSDIKSFEEVAIQNAAKN